MEAIDTDDEYLDDPITLIDFEQHRFGYNTIQKDYDKFKAAVSYENQNLLSNQKHSFVLSETQFNLNNNTKLLDMCQPVNIRVVDCVKYPWYYKLNADVKTELHHRVYDQDAVNEDTLSKCDDISVKSKYIHKDVMENQKNIVEKNELSVTKNAYSSCTHTERKTTNNYSGIDFKMNIGLIDMTKRHIPSDQLTENNNKTENDILAKHEKETCLLRQELNGMHFDKQKQIDNLIFSPSNLRDNESTLMNKVETNICLGHENKNGCKMDEIEIRRVTKKGPNGKEASKLIINTKGIITNNDSKLKFVRNKDNTEIESTKPESNNMLNTIEGNSKIVISNKRKIEDIRSKSPILPCTGMINIKKEADTEELIIRSNKLRGSLLNREYDQNLKCNLNLCNKLKEKQNSPQSVTMSKIGNMSPQLQSKFDIECSTNNKLLKKTQIIKEQKHVSLNEQDRNILFNVPVILNDVVKNLYKNNNSDSKNTATISPMKTNNLILSSSENKYNKEENSNSEEYEYKFILGESFTGPKPDNTYIPCKNTNPVQYNVMEDMDHSKTDVYEKEMTDSHVILTPPTPFMTPIGPTNVVKHQIPHRHFRIPPASKVLLLSSGKNNKKLSPTCPQEYKASIEEKRHKSLPQVFIKTLNDNFPKLPKFKQSVIHKHAFTDNGNNLPIICIPQGDKDINKNMQNMIKIHERTYSSSTNQTNGYSPPILPIPTYQRTFEHLTEISLYDTHNVSKNKSVVTNKKILCYLRRKFSDKDGREEIASSRKRKLEVTNVTEPQSIKKISLNDYKRRSGKSIIEPIDSINNTQFKLQDKNLTSSSDMDLI